jgi:hypothetical protein
MKISRLLPVLVGLAVVQAYVACCFLAIKNPTQPGLWHTLFGPLTFDLGPHPEQFKGILLGFEVLLYLALVLSFRHLILKPKAPANSPEGQASTQSPFPPVSKQ